MKSKLFTILLLIFCTLIFALTVRGVPGNPTQDSLHQDRWKDDGPFELSPERGRFALMYSVVENHAVQFSLPLARFISPDVAYYNGRYVSLFPPGVSFAIIPGYLIGKYFDLAQVGAFAISSVFAILNFFLIRSIAIRIGAHPLAAVVAGLTFLFATPAFPYAVSLYQHHIFVFILLLAMYIIFRWKNFWSVSAVWFLTGLSISLDNPNVFFMIPVSAYAFLQIINIEKLSNTIKVKINILWFLTLIFGLIPLLFLMWFNVSSHGNAFKLSGTLPGVKAIDAQGKPAIPSQSTKTEDREKYLKPETQKKSVARFFKTRNLLNGFYVHFISPDRGIIYFTPIMILALWGLFAINKEYFRRRSVLFGTIGFNILLYSMWGDPWGGWAFGSRYLIPGYAALSILLAMFITKFGGKLAVLLLVLTLTAYSVNVNTLGALTTNRIPPEGEARALSLVSHKDEKFSYDRNIEYLNTNRSKSFLFQTYLDKNLKAWEYYRLISGGITGFISIFAIYLYLIKRKKRTHA